MWIFVLLLPLALVPQFAEIGTELTKEHPLRGDLFVCFSIPFYVIVAWIFHTMERIGRTRENSFEGTANDVPISTIARGIDLRQNLGEKNEEIPKQFPIRYNNSFRGLFCIQIVLIYHTEALVWYQYTIGIVKSCCFVILIH